MKWLIVIAFVLILGSLASALVFMMRDGQGGRPKSSNMVKALALRVAFSVALFACIWTAYGLGWIQPTGLPVGR